MPTYEFRCEAGHSFDRFLKMSEAPLELVCAECGNAATRQMSGGAGLVFKGSGFYLTDYGRAGQKQSTGEGAAAGGAADKGASSETKTDSAKTADSKAAKADSGTPTGSPDKGSSAKSDKSGSTKTSKPSE